MFEYFPGNYVWNLGVVAALNSGGLIDEVDRACRPIRELASQGSDVGTAQFMDAWSQVADQLEQQARRYRTVGHLRTAGQTYLRAAGYVAQAERMQSAKDAGRNVVYQRCLDLMAKSFSSLDPRTRRVEVPFEGGSLPAYFTDASIGDEPAPVMVMWNGLDSTKEHVRTSGFGAELAARGISTLMVDCPGSGEALTLRGLTARVHERGLGDSMRRLSPDPTRRAGRTASESLGWSLGGYYAPRAAALEKRIALCVAWGANHNWGAVQKRRLEREGENPVPHYWDHVMWVWGESDVQDVHQPRRSGPPGRRRRARSPYPFLITHGQNDRQIPVSDAHRSYEQAVNSPKREACASSPQTREPPSTSGSTTSPTWGGFIADWVAEEQPPGLVQ